MFSRILAKYKDLELSRAFNGELCVFSTTHKRQNCNVSGMKQWDMVCFLYDFDYSLDDLSYMLMFDYDKFQNLLSELGY